MDKILKLNKKDGLVRLNWYKKGNEMNLTFLSISLMNLVVIVFIRYIFLKDLENKTETKEELEKVNKKRDKTIITSLCTLYLICTYSGLYIVRLKNISSASDFGIYIGYMIIGLVPYSILGSICAGFRKFWILLGTIMIFIGSYGIVYMLV